MYIYIYICIYRDREREREREIEIEAPFVLDEGLKSWSRLLFIISIIMIL